jgi:glycosyltransferase involved in cell wall biosynthesis
MGEIKRIKVAFVCTSLEVGGAQTMIRNLLSHIDHRIFAVQVVSLVELGPIAEHIEALGVPVKSIGMRRGVPNPLGLIRLFWWLRQNRPDVIHTWMYHADLLGGLAAKLAGDIPVIWNIHIDFTKNKPLTMATIRLCALLSPWIPKCVVCCGESPLKTHVSVGYAADKVLVIPNGVDCEVYKPDEATRSSIRKELAIPEDAGVVGMIARFHQNKDHQMFFKAAMQIRQSANVHFVLSGTDITWDNHELVMWISEAGISNRCHLLGPRNDVERIMKVLDILCLSSRAEGSPVVVLEAMSSGVVCAVTDVGDCAAMVGQTGWAVGPGDWQAMGTACSALLALDPERRRQSGLDARKRVLEHFNIARSVERYVSLYQQFAQV